MFFLDGAGWTHTRHGERLTMQLQLIAQERIIRDAFAIIVDSGCVALMLSPRNGSNVFAEIKKQKCVWWMGARESRL